MAQNVYESMFIFDSNTYARDPNGVSDKIPKIVENCSGEMLASRLWNEQRLAYPIKGRRKGTYWLSYFRLDGSKLVDFNRACQLNDDVLRSLTLKVDPRLAATLVAHARGEEIPTTTVEEATTEPATAEQPVAGSDGNAKEEEPSADASKDSEADAGEQKATDESVQ